MFYALSKYVTLKTVLQNQTYPLKTKVTSPPPQIMNTLCNHICFYYTGVKIR